MDNHPNGGLTRAPQPRQSGRLASTNGEVAVLQWKARLLASLVTLALLAGALVGGGAKFIIYLDW